MNKPKTWLIITILYSLLTFALSLIAGDTKLPLMMFKFHRADLVIHAIEYAIFSLCVLKYLQTLGILAKKRWMYFMPILLTAVIGAANEGIQYFVPGRFPTVSDGVANVIGAMVPVLIWISIQSLRKKHKTS